MKEGSKIQFKINNTEESPLFTKDEVKAIIHKASSIAARKKTHRMYWNAAAGIVAVLGFLAFFEFRPEYKQLSDKDSFRDYEVRYATFIQDIQNNSGLAKTGLVIPDHSRVPMHMFALVQPPENVLEKLGFTFSYGRIQYSANVKSAGYLGFGITATNNSVSVSDNQREGLKEYESYPLFLTYKDGRQSVRYRFDNEDEDKLTPSYFEKHSQHLVPLLLEVPGSEKQVVFWFLQTDALLDLLRTGVPSDRRISSNVPLGERKIRVYPNPANNVVNVQIELGDENIKVELLTIEGRTLKTLLPSTKMTAGTEELHLNLSGIEDGMYLLSIKSDSAPEIVRRVFVQKK